jgi:hypothetical protein
LTASEEFPPVEVEYTLRVTRRGLDDLGVRVAGPADFDGILAETRDADIVEKFLELRAKVPTGTDAPMKL